MSSTMYGTHLDRVYAPGTFARKLRCLRHNLGLYLHAGQSVLEIGPGRGEFLELLKQCSITDVDAIQRAPDICPALSAQYRPTRLWNLAVEARPQT